MKKPILSEIFRGTVFHTPRNPFLDPDALVSLPQGALLVENGRIAACDSYVALRRMHPNSVVHDLRGGFLLPGLVDAHVHFPQTRIIGGLGYGLLDWLQRITLPEEARMADAEYALRVAGEFTRALAVHGTTTALVFGSHFAGATAALFDAALKRGIRVISGLVVSDRALLPELHITPEKAYRENLDLMRRFAGHPRIGYAVTPRFALSASEGMLDVCGALLRENPASIFQTHLNENHDEIEAVNGSFAWAGDYLGVYERFGLCGPRSVFAHSVHSSRAEIARMAAAGASVAHCPCSNASLGSGIFPLGRHLAAGVRVGLGTDVGAGTGFGIMKEALQAYLLQRVAPEPFTLSPAQMLYLATRAGADVVGLGAVTGDFTPGKAADFIYLRPPEKSPLHNVLGQTEDPQRQLAALLTMAGEESVREVRVEGDVVYQNLC